MQIRLRRCSRASGNSVTKPLRAAESLSKRCTLAVLLLLTCQAAYALQLGGLRVDSTLGQTLDANVPLLDAAETDSADLRLLYVDVSVYRRMGLDYTPLHERIVTELVLTTGPPHVAVSSIGSVNRPVFDLVVGVLHRGVEVLKNYRVELPEPVAPKPVAPSVMSAPEVLSHLLDLVGTQRGLSRAEALAGLKRLVQPGVAVTGEKRLLMRLDTVSLGPAFVAGIKALLDNKAAAALERALRADGAVVAATAVLFGGREHALLKGLLSHGAAATLQEGADLSQRVVFMKEKVAVLENRLVELERLIEQSRAPVVSAPARDAPSFFTRLHRWLHAHGWLDGERLLARPLWRVFAVLFTLLLLLTGWWQWHRLRAAANHAGPQSAARRGFAHPLPGLQELANLRRDPAVAALAAEDDVTNCLSLARTYMEMGEREEAARLVDKVIAEGNPRQQRRAQELREKLK